MVLVGLGALGLLGSQLTSERTDAPTIPAATEDELEAQAPEPPPGPRLLPASVVARSALEGIDLREGEMADGLPADAFFVLEAEVPLPDLRLRLFDDRHRLVPADERIQLGESTRYLLQPKEALKAGTTYTLVADGQESAKPSDASGQAYLPARYTLTILGG